MMASKTISPAKAVALQQPTPVSHRQDRFTVIVLYGAHDGEGVNHEVNAITTQLI